jgi:hypothetical protein
MASRCLIDIQVSDSKNTSEDSLPTKYISKVLGIEKSSSDLEDGPFVPPPPKPRGITGSVPVQPQQVQGMSFTQPALSMQGPPSQPPNWNPYPYPPFLFSLPSPYKHMFAPQLPLECPASPSRWTNPNRDGPPLGEWFAELDWALGEDDEHYSPLLPQLSEMGARRVYDLTLHEAKTIEKRTGCSETMALQLIAKAETLMQKILV